MTEERTLYLTKSNGYFTNTSPIIMDGKAFKVQVQSVYDLAVNSVVLTNGEETEKVKIIDKCFTVPDSLAFSGWLNITVNMYMDGVSVKSWTITPIKIIEIEESQTVDSAAATMQSQEERLTTLEECKASKEDLAQIKQAYNDLAEKYNKLVDIVEVLKQQ